MGLINNYIINEPVIGVMYVGILGVVVVRINESRSWKLSQGGLLISKGRDARRIF